MPARPDNEGQTSGGSPPSEAHASIQEAGVPGARSATAASTVDTAVAMAPAVAGGHAGRRAGDPVHGGPDRGARPALGSVAVPRALRERRAADRPARAGRPARKSKAAAPPALDLARAVTPKLASSRPDGLAESPEAGRAATDAGVRDRPRSAWARSGGRERLVAILDADTVVVPDARGLPARFRIGDRLPSGARVTRIDPAHGSADTDHGTLHLE